MFVEFGLSICFLLFTIIMEIIGIIGIIIIGNVYKNNNLNCTGTGTLFLKEGKNP